MQTFRIRFAPDIAQLSLSWSEAASARRESVGEGAELGYDDRGQPVELVLSGLAQACRTNAALSPMVRCGDEQPLSGRDGTELYWLALGPQLLERAFFQRAEPRRDGPDGAA